MEVSHMNNHEPTIRVIRILELVSYYSEKGLSLKEIMNKLDMPKTTVYNILSTLVDQGVLIEIDEGIKVYKLGFLAYIIASRYIEKLDILNIADRILKDLSDVTGLTSFVAKVDHKNIYYLFKYSPDGARVTQAEVNSTNYVHSTALGKAYLMTLNNDALDRVLDYLDYIRFTDATCKDKDTLKADVLMAKQNGFSLDQGETEKNLICYGAPITDQKGNFIASISISGLKTQDDTSPLYGKLIKQAADKISEQLNK
jgi:DNA-binding IclR family transcriptional regulator